MAARKLLAVVEKKVDLPVEATQADGPSGLRQPVETLPSIHTRRPNCPHGGATQPKAPEWLMFTHPRALPAGFIAPCLPIHAPQPPSGEQWLHEIKQTACSTLALVIVLCGLRSHA
jgi:hypothetical protein